VDQTETSGKERKMRREVDVEMLGSKLRDNEFLELARREPDAALGQIPLKPTEDVTLYRITVVVLGAVVLVAALGAVWLGYWAQDVPELLVALGSAAVGALAGLLAPFSG
jgi:hypothetical protein